MNWDEIKGSWKEMRGRVREQWGKLTDDDVDIIAGRRDRLVGLIQQRYGTLKEDADAQVTAFERRLGRDAQSGQFVTWPLVGIFLLVAIAALKIGSTFVLPIVVSVLFTFLLGPPVRWLKKRRIPEAIGAGVLVFGTVIVLCGAMYFLSDPAAEWIERAPKTMVQVERKLRRVFRPLASIQETASKVEEATTPTSER